MERVLAIHGEAVDELEVGMCVGVWVDGTSKVSVAGSYEIVVSEWTKVSQACNPSSFGFVSTWNLSSININT